MRDRALKKEALLRFKVLQCFSFDEKVIDDSTITDWTMQSCH